MQEDMRKRIEHIRDATDKPSFSFNLAEYFERISDNKKIKKAKKREERHQKEALSASRKETLKELERSLKDSISPDTEEQRMVFWVSHFDIQIQRIRGTETSGVYTTSYHPGKLSKEKFLFVQLSPSEALKIDFDPLNDTFNVTNLIGHSSIARTGWREHGDYKYEDKDGLIDKIKHSMANAVVENEIAFPKRVAWLAAKRLTQAGLIFVFLRSCSPDVFAEEIHDPNDLKISNGGVSITIPEPIR